MIENVHIEDLNSEKIKNLLDSLWKEFCKIYKVNGEKYSTIELISVTANLTNYIINWMESYHNEDKHLLLKETFLISLLRIWKLDVMQVAIDINNLSSTVDITPTKEIGN